MKIQRNLELYLVAAVRFCIAFIAVPLLMLLATLCLELPSWLMAAGIISLGIIAFLVAIAPFRFLLTNAKQIFTEGIAAQVVFCLGAVLFWLLLWTLTKLLPKQQPICLFIPLLFLSLFGMAWLNVGSVLGILNVVGFVLAVGHKLTRLGRCVWYLLVTLLPTAGILLFLYGPGGMDSSKLSFAIVALAFAVWLGIRDFSNYPPISSPSRYDPAASMIARLFGQRGK
jgi:hypothetical protein